MNLVTSYTYDAVGSLDTVTQSNGVVSDYGYDGLNRLTSLLVTEGDGDKLFEQTNTYITTYEVDLAGNRVGLQWSIQPTKFSPT